MNSVNFHKGKPCFYRETDSRYVQDINRIDMYLFLKKDIYTYYNNHTTDIKNIRQDIDFIEILV